MTDVQEAKIMIDNVEYKVADLSDNAKAQVQSIQFADTEVMRLNRLLAMTQTARNAYIQALNADLPKES